MRWFDGVQRNLRMITAAECKTRQVECQVQGTDPDIPMRRGCDHGRLPCLERHEPSGGRKEEGK
jgi:hypothetical protein